MYETNGEKGLSAVQSIDQRTEDVRQRCTTLNGEQLDYLSDTRQLVGGLSTPIGDDLGKGKTFSDRDTAVDDAYLRSAEEGTSNSQFHSDESDVTACGRFTNFRSVRWKQLY